MTADEEPDRDDEVLDGLRKLREELQSEPELVSTDPREAYELWIGQLEDKRESTKASYWYRIKPFLEFLDEAGIDDLSELTTRHVTEFESVRREGDRTQQTLNNQFTTLRLFLDYCSDLNAVSEDIVESVNVPELSKEDRVNTEKLITERAQRILDELEQYRYASRDHVIMLLLWRTTMRVGAVRSIDLDDLYLSEEDRERLRDQLRGKGLESTVVDELLNDVELPVVYPRHRTETGTPLKNGLAGERVINIADWVGDVFRSYIRVNRDDLVDEYERRPLLTSSKGGAGTHRRPSGTRYIS